MSKRSYGTGSLDIHTDAAGGQAWYGRWRVNGRRFKRKIGPKRMTGSREGLTQTQAEAELRRLIESEGPTSPRSGLTIGEAGERMLLHLEGIGRKPTTLSTYRTIFRTHLVPRLGEVQLDRATPEQVEGLIAAMRRDGKKPKTIAGALTLLRQIFGHGIKKGWCRENPCAQVDRPQVEQDPEIHFLNQDELEALLRASTFDAEPYGPTDRAMVLTAAMTGLRQGELLALQWQDIDWEAERIRVRRSFVRGHQGSPKSRRGIRSVPLIDRVAGDLDRHFQRSAFQADDDLVFPHPHIGKHLDHSALVRRFKKALRAAGLKPVRFNDLRHSFATAMAGAGVPMRTLQEWMGHRDFGTTLIYADYAPSAQEKELVEAAFARGPNRGPNLSASERIGEHRSVPE